MLSRTALTRPPRLRCLILLLSVFVVNAGWRAPLALIAQEGATAQELPALEWTELMISPRAVQQPWLEIHLLPDRSQTIEGNAVPILLRQAWERSGDYWQKMGQADEFLKGSIEDFDPVKLRRDVPAPPLSELQRAAFRTHAHWEYPLRETDEPHAILLPDVQGMRALIRTMAAYCRADIAERNPTAALEKITIGFGVAQHVASAPFLITKLVAMHNQHLMLDRVEELTALSESPNLYWALTMLPEFTMELRDCIDWERKLIQVALPAEGEQNFDWRKAAQKIGGITRSSLNDFADRIEKLGGERAALDKFVERARARLPEVMPEVMPELAERVPQMSPEEVGVRYFVSEYIRVSDRALAAMAVGPHEGLDFVREMSAEREARKQDLLDVSELTVSPLLAVRTTWRLQRRIAALRTIELLRDYAASHEGKLPAKLTELTAFPLPLDPIMKQPFQYRVEGSIAYLWAEEALDDLVETRRVAYSIRIK